MQADAERLRVVLDRTYYLRDGVWIDSTHTDQETIDIVFFGEAYFDLAWIVPGIGPHLAVGDRVIIAVGELFVRIGDEGAETLTQEMIDALTP